jgi:hypothetical protein
MNADTRDQILGLGARWAQAEQDGDTTVLEACT